MSRGLEPVRTQTCSEKGPRPSFPLGASAVVPQNTKTPSWPSPGPRAPADLGSSRHRPTALQDPTSCPVLPGMAGERALERYWLHSCSRLAFFPLKRGCRSFFPFLRKLAQADNRLRGTRAWLATGNRTILASSLRPPPTPTPHTSPGILPKGTPRPFPVTAPFRGAHSTPGA